MNKPTTLFWIIAVLALLWNLMGIYQFVASIALPEVLTADYGPEALELMTSQPMWYTVCFGIATISGLIACIALLARKRLAVTLFLISLIAVLITESYWIFGTNAREVMGDAIIYMPIVVVILSFVFYLYSTRTAKKGWLQ